MRRCALLLCAAAGVSGAGKIEDHSLSWAAAGLTHALAAGHEQALPQALYAAVVAAAPLAQRQSTESYKFGKHNTWWLPLHDEQGRPTRPQSAIEAAVLRLYDLDFGRNPTPIIGAEWWLQERGPQDSIGYHYDKDEAYASEHMTMRFPEVSTVTYLGASGAPTLIFNQTTPDGNLEVPELPVEAALVHPNPNKHLVFRGNLQHGVSGELAHGGAQKRSTLLINWWRYMPMPPNCVRFGADRWQRLELHLDEAKLAALGRPDDGEAAPQPIAWSPLVIDPATARRVVVEVAPTDQLYFSFPEAMAAGNWHVQWNTGEAIGPLARLDLFHQRSLNAIFNDARPKLFLVFPSRTWKQRSTPGQPTNWATSLPKWLHELQGLFGETFKFVLVEPREAADFMRQFSLTTADAPTAVIHDTARGGAKYRLRDKLRKKTMWRFVEDFVAQRLQKDEL